MIGPTVIDSRVGRGTLPRPGLVTTHGPFTVGGSIYVCLQDQGVSPFQLAMWRSTDSGRTWSEQAAGAGPSIGTFYAGANGASYSVVQGSGAEAANLYVVYIAGTITPFIRIAEFSTSSNTWTSASIATDAPLAGNGNLIRGGSSTSDVATTVWITRRLAAPRKVVVVHHDPQVAIGVSLLVSVWNPSTALWELNGVPPTGMPINRLFCGAVLDPATDSTRLFYIDSAGNLYTQTLDASNVFSGITTAASIYLPPSVKFPHAESVGRPAPRTAAGAGYTVPVKNTSNLPAVLLDSPAGVVQVSTIAPFTGVTFTVGAKMMYAEHRGGAHSAADVWFMDSGTNNLYQATRADDGTWTVTAWRTDTANGVGAPGMQAVGGQVTGIFISYDPPGFLTDRTFYLSDADAGSGPSASPGWLATHGLLRRPPAPPAAIAPPPPAPATVPRFRPLLQRRRQPELDSMFPWLCDPDYWCPDDELRGARGGAWLAALLGFVILLMLADDGPNDRH